MIKQSLEKGNTKTRAGKGKVTLTRLEFIKHSIKH